MSNVHVAVCPCLQNDSSKALGKKASHWHNEILDGIYTFNELILRSNQSWLICRMMLAHVSFKETST